jgi:hypothetical protein
MTGIDDLFGVPTPQLLETPLSWLSRVALMQGTRTRELLQYLSVDAGVTELELAQLRGDAQDRVFGQHLATLSHALKVLANIAKIDPTGSIFLLKHRRQAAFRFCPRCFGEQREPHVPVEWRVSSWRYCPLHRCMLLNTCHRCGSTGTLPAEMRSAGADRRGIGYLNRCRSCSTRLSEADPPPLDVKGHALTATERCLLQNGRASLATFYTGKFVLAPSSRNEGLVGLSRLERQGLVPTSRSRADLEMRTTPP